MVVSGLAVVFVLGSLAAARAAVRGRNAAGVRRRLALVPPREPASMLGRLPSVRLIDRFLRSRAATRYAEQLPMALESMAASLRSGASPRDALVEAAHSVGGRLGEELAEVAVAATVTGLDHALSVWADARPTAGVAVVAAAMGLGLETGGAHAAAVDGLAATLRQQQAAAADARALAAQARLSAMVIAAAPAVFAVFTVATDRTSASFLVTTPVGLTCLISGLALDAAGWWWMSRITSIGTGP